MNYSDVLKLYTAIKSLRDIAYDKIAAEFVRQYPSQKMLAKLNGEVEAYNNVLYEFEKRGVKNEKKL